jgi:hypothetical protein
MKIDNLRELYHAYVVSITSTSRDDCPSSQAILKTIGTNRSFKKKKALIEHISRCSYCKEEFIVLLKIEHLICPYLSDLTKHAQESYPIFKPIRPSLLSPIFVKYASVIIGFMLLLFSSLIIVKMETASDILRSKTDTVQLIYPDNIHNLSLPLVFQWAEHPTTEYYILELFNETMITLWTSPANTEISCFLPNEIFKKLEKNKSYYWMISAFSNTQKIAESNLGWFLTR